MQHLVPSTSARSHRDRIYQFLVQGRNPPKVSTGGPSQDITWWVQRERLRWCFGSGGRKWKKCTLTEATTTVGKGVLHCLERSPIIVNRKPSPPLLPSLSLRIPLSFSPSSFHYSLFPSLMCGDSACACVILYARAHTRMHVCTHTLMTSPTHPHTQ